VAKRNVGSIALAGVSLVAGAPGADGDDAHMRDLFVADPARAERFSLQVGDVLLDYSKNRITDETMKPAHAAGR
jgi:hypothetical protein